MGGRGAFSGKRGGFSADEAGSHETMPKKLESLNSIKDRKVYKAVKESISRYESVLGVRQRDIKLGELPTGVGGVHVTQGGKSKIVVLNKEIFNGEKTNLKKLSNWSEKAYKSGHLTSTNKPTAHIVTHELAHATWNEHQIGSMQKKAGFEINKVYNNWIKDTKKKGYGDYAKTNESEFFAEVVTKAIHGKKDKYTAKVKGIIKKYNL